MTQGYPSSYFQSTFEVDPRIRTGPHELAWGEIMRRGVSLLGSILSVVLCSVLAACGGTTSGGNSGNGGGGGSNPPPPPPPTVTMQQGQWEFSVNNGAYFIESNLTDASGTVTSTVYNTAVLNPQPVVAGQPGGFDCGNVGLSATISEDTLTGTVGSDGATEINFSGTVASNGQSVTNGTFSNVSPPGTGCAPEGAATSGTFTGYVVPSLTGTYSGQITSWPSNTTPYSCTLTLTQNSDFSISGTGVATSEGYVQNFTFPAATGNTSGVIGATFNLSGSWSSGTQSQVMQLTGHSNPSGSQITVTILYGDGPGDNDWWTGTLTKQ
jgi:hypothetical protein